MVIIQTPIMERKFMNENSLNINAKVWQELYANGKNDLQYPSDAFVRLTYRHFGPGVRKVLDYGCGTGANLLHLAQRGMEMAGFEISTHALEILRQRVQECGSRADLRLGVPGASLPWADGQFDSVVAWHVLCYNDWSSWEHSFKELDRVLRPKGVFIAATTAPGDISHHLSTQIGDFLYRSKVPSQEGCVLLIPDEQALSRCFPGKDIEVGEMLYRFGDTISRHWIVVYRKGSCGKL